MFNPLGQFWRSVLGDSNADFTGRHVWLVGASDGIGEALAFELARRGASLTLSARREDRLEAIARRLPGSGHRVAALDVTDLPSIERAVAGFARDGQQLDMLVYLSGMMQRARAHEMEIASAERTVDTNLTGCIRVCQAALPLLKERAKEAGESWLVLTGSIVGFGGMPEMADYAATKAGINMLAECYAIDLLPHKVRVQRICPGHVRTRMTEEIPFKTIGTLTPEKAARAIARRLGQEGVFEIAIPFWLVKAFKLTGWLPRSWYIWLTRRAADRARKPE